MTDTCPFTLGIDVINYADRNNSIMSPIIERNSILPSSKKKFYTNAVDYQSKMIIKVYQGEEYFCRDNIYLGELQVDIKRKKKGENSIEVCFTYDINGILLVEVTDLDSDKKREKVLTSGTSRMRAEELGKRVEELKAYKLAGPGDVRTKLVLARGERLFAQTLGGRREMISKVMGKLHEAIGTQNDQRIINCVKEAEKVFDFLEGKGYQE